MAKSKMVAQKTPPTGRQIPTNPDKSRQIIFELAGLKVLGREPPPGGAFLCRGAHAATCCWESPAPLVAQEAGNGAGTVV